MRPSVTPNVAIVAALCVILRLVLLPYYSYSAMLLLIQEEWGMSSGEAGFVFGATQIGYVLAVLLLLPLTDRTRTSYVILGSAVLALVGNMLFALLAQGVVSGSFFRALSGAGIAGTYMPGLRLISERFSAERRGGPIGIYVAAFVLGGAVSFGGTAAIVPHLGWRGAYLATSLATIGAIALSIPLVRAERSRPDRTRSSRRAGSPIGAVLRSKPILLMTAGYTGHVWELFGMRSWLAPFLATLLIRMGSDTTSASAQAAFLSSITVLLGTASTSVSGVLSDRLGRTATAGAILALSGTCSLAIGWLMDAPFWVVVAVAMVYGFWVNPDSPIYSTGITEVAPPSRLGTVMAFQTMSGWTTGIIAPVAFGVVLDMVPGDAAWGVGFASLGVGAFGGVAAMIALRRSPESVALAGGKR